MSAHIFLNKKLIVGIITFISVAIAAIYSNFFVSDGVRAAAQKPNIVIIMADDLGWNDVGYHNSEIKTPNLDKLAESSTRLDRFYVTSSCTPTRAALMTGRHPSRYGMSSGVIWPWDKVGLPLEEKTIAQTLKEAGYYTAIVGKWHLGHYKEEYLPTRRGFDYHYGHYCGSIDYFTHQLDAGIQGGLDWHRNEQPVEEEGYATDLLAQEAVKLIRDCDYNKSPLFLYVSFNAPHAPLQAKEKDIKNYANIQDEGRRIFAAQVQSMDEAVGRIVAALKEKQVWDNTLLFFTSDNGGGSDQPWTRGDNRPLRGQKGTLYDGGVRVPTIISFPAQLKGGQVIEQVFSVVDLYPTLAKLAGVKESSQNQLDGVDILESIATGSTRRDEVLIQYQALASPPWFKAALVKENYKLVLNSTSPSPYYGIAELFNLKNDPLETRNLAYSEPEKVLELQKRVEAHKKEAKSPILNNSTEMPPGFVIPKVWSPKYLQASRDKEKSPRRTRILDKFSTRSIVLVSFFMGVLSGSVATIVLMFIRKRKIAV
ncbi:MAG: arylsulfatase [Hydrococcus sp. C42_A2020_068]|uniref:arylsulfatase B n=1 Tax=Pleurocapsa sp. PCC 7327 TaxID=118163 RepID=UPI00029F8CCF|nr:arylsulfatase [Pleurocapsa sp. PCC 7327]AFY77447.1 arylsulfatase A family protein [Pleurocapsa sp. PCC 7327]MBF2020659.1 arylsulfatase [Hydrococcus sp. C42_A2020_068]